MPGCFSRGGQKNPLPPAEFALSSLLLLLLLLLLAAFGIEIPPLLRSQ